MAVKMGIIHLDEKYSFIVKQTKDSGIYEWLGIKIGQIVSPELLPEPVLTQSQLENSSIFPEADLREKCLLYTPFVPGKKIDVSNPEFLNYRYPELFSRAIGRQHALHKFLSITEVKGRHFIIDNETIKRVNLESAFSGTMYLASLPKEQAKKEAKIGKTEFPCWTDDKAYSEGVISESRNILLNFSKNRQTIENLLENTGRMGSIELENKDITRASNPKQLVSDIKTYWQIIGILK